MRNQVKVSLKRPFAGHEGQVSEIVLQEPSANDFFALGAPQSWVRAGAGMALVDDERVIRAYVERCMIAPDPVLAFNLMSIVDAIAVKDAVLSFFTGAASSAPGSETTSSNSTSSPTT